VILHADDVANAAPVVPITAGRVGKSVVERGVDTARTAGLTRFILQGTGPTPPPHPPGRERPRRIATRHLRL
jgi:hypothetical protein